MVLTTKVRVVNDPRRQYFFWIIYRIKISSRRQGSGHNKHVTREMWDVGIARPRISGPNLVVKNLLAAVQCALT